jgi:hypothetical protein
MPHPLYDLLRALDEARVNYHLARHRPDSVCVTLTHVGERSEVEVFDDGHMEVSRFHGNEAVVGGTDLAFQLIETARGD